LNASPCIECPAGGLAEIYADQTLDQKYCAARKNKYKNQAATRMRKGKNIHAH
jgi:hypothetical protein